MNRNKSSPLTRYSETASPAPIRYTQCIALNNKTRFGSSDWNAYPADVYFNNCVGWGAITRYNNDFIHSQGDLVVNHCTFGMLLTLQTFMEQHP